MMLLISKERGASRAETCISPAAPSAPVPASTNPAVCSNGFIFLCFLRDASLHTITDLTLFLYKLSSLFLAFVVLPTVIVIVKLSLSPPCLVIQGTLKGWPLPVSPVTGTGDREVRARPSVPWGRQLELCGVVS